MPESVLKSIYRYDPSIRPAYITRDLSQKLEQAAGTLEELQNKLFNMHAIIHDPETGLDLLEYLHEKLARYLAQTPEPERDPGTIRRFEDAIRRYTQMDEASIELSPKLDALIRTIYHTEDDEYGNPYPVPRP